ncbi:hypothetical protein TSUD_261170 [Trifolium subterraneum]|uniref:Uncharacterized protein n=1 Tax=Trifolium subterraneum TaxID=3900 RepID=A0A2Z6MZL8_TRISU|nr:hypothetical protein TSUD_261170 [Trifolium subterraneum]
MHARASQMGDVIDEVAEFTLKVVREHNSLGRDVELFRRHLYTSGNLGPATEGSKGAELVDGLVIKEEDYKLVKTSSSNT